MEYVILVSLLLHVAFEREKEKKTKQIHKCDANITKYAPIKMRLRANCVANVFCFTEIPNNYTVSTVTGRPSFVAIEFLQCARQKQIDKAICDDKTKHRKKEKKNQQQQPVVLAAAANASTSFLFLYAVFFLFLSVSLALCCF